MKLLDRLSIAVWLGGAAQVATLAIWHWSAVAVILAGDVALGLAFYLALRPRR